MKRGRFTEEQIIGVLREQEAVTKTADLCRKHRISEAIFYAWKAEYGGLGVAEAKRLKALEGENGKLKRFSPNSQPLLTQSGAYPPRPHLISPASLALVH